MNKTPADLEVFGARVLATRYQQDTIGRLVVPEYTKQVSSRGTVVAIGDACQNTHVGDDIIFGRYAPFELPTKQHEDLRDIPELLIMNEEDILLRISPSKE
jgi:co-chaperonin GroES (HSP10)